MVSLTNCVLRHAPVRRAVLFSGLCGLTILGLALLTGSAQAQSAPEPTDSPTPEEGGSGMSEGIEEIVVTGERATGISTDVPTSATEFDAEALDALGVQDVSDLALVTPNLEINTISATTPTFFIRGVGLNDFSSNATGAVAIYQDGVPINAPALQLSQMFDVQSAAVMRGPQSYGNERNASAGLIGVSSRLPTGDFESTLRADFGRFNLRDFEGALALPLAGEGALSTRIAFRYTERDPLIQNRCGGLDVPTQGACGSIANPISQPVPPGLPKEVGDQKRWGLRGLFRLQPLETDTDWLLNVHAASIDQDSSLGQVIGTGSRMRTVNGYVDPAIDAIFDKRVQAFRDSGSSAPEARRKAYLPTLKDVTDDIGRTGPFRSAYNQVGREKLDSVGGSLRGEMYLGDVQLRTISGAESYDRSRKTDFDFHSNTAIHSNTQDEAWQVTQSLDFESELERVPLTWRAGAFFLTEDLDSNTAFTFNFSQAGTPGGEQKVNQSYSQKDYSYGVYGNFEWAFHEAFSLSGGARFNSDKKDFELTVRNPNAPQARVQPSSASETWTAPTGAIALTYHPIDELEIYAKYSRGWKPGVFNSAILRNEVVSTGLVPDIKITDPEQLDAFEIGLSAQFFDQTVEMRAAIFYYEYNDYQVFTLKNRFGSPPQFEIVNADDAEIYGAELDVFAQPLMGRVPALWEQLILEVRASWLESEFLDFTDTRTIFLQNVVVTDVLDFSGNRLPNTPRYKVSGSVRYPFELNGLGTITPRYDMSYTDDIFFDASQGVGRPLGAVTELSQYAVGQKSYVLHNVRLSYAVPNDRIEISGWVRNLTDVRYKTYVADASASIEGLLNWVGDPRTYGVSLSFSW